MFYYRDCPGAVLFLVVVVVVCCCEVAFVNSGSMRRGKKYRTKALGRIEGSAPGVRSSMHSLPFSLASHLPALPSVIVCKSAIIVRDASCSCIWPSTQSRHSVKEIGSPEI